MVVHAQCLVIGVRAVFGVERQELCVSGFGSSVQSLVFQVQCLVFSVERSVLRGSCLEISV